jgi:hypothetical protein
MYAALEALKKLCRLLLSWAPAYLLFGLGAGVVYFGLWSSLDHGTRRTSILVRLVNWRIMEIEKCYDAETRRGVTC